MVWVAQPTDKTIRTVETTRSVVSVEHIVGDWGYPTPSPISYAQGRSASLEKLPLHGEVQFRSVPNYQYVLFSGRVTSKYILFKLFDHAVNH